MQRRHLLAQVRPRAPCCASRRRPVRGAAARVAWAFSDRLGLLARHAVAPHEPLRSAAPRAHRPAARGRRGRAAPPSTSSGITSDLVGSAGRLRLALHLGADGRVQDRFEAAPAPRVREDDARAARRGRGGRRRRARRGRSARRPAASAGWPGSTTSRAIDVGVDDRHAERGEQVGDGGLAAGDAAGEGDAERSAGLHGAARRRHRSSAEPAPGSRRRSAVPTSARSSRRRRDTGRRESGCCGRGRAATISAMPTTAPATAESRMIERQHLPAQPGAERRRAA